MKRCPTCNRTFTDPSLSFCIDDGTPLIADTVDETTVVSPSPEKKSTQSYSPPGWTTPGYVPPGAQPGAAQRKRRVWPWVVGILGLLLLAVIGLGVVAAIYLPRMMSNRNASSSRNTNASNGNFNSRNRNARADANSNNANQDATANSNANVENANVAANANNSGAPTNQDDVLSMLTDLEHDWTVANINADKKALERILADDYVATVDGRSVGKAEYIKTIQRDTTTQDWKFEDLKLDLKGTRATLSGLVRYKTRQGDASYRFVDKFVWRDGRWQATGSEISQVS